MVETLVALGGRALDNDSGHLDFISDCATGLFYDLGKVAASLWPGFPVCQSPTYFGTQFEM